MQRLGKSFLGYPKICVILVPNLEKQSLLRIKHLDLPCFLLYSTIPHSQASLSSSKQLLGPKVPSSYGVPASPGRVESSRGSLFLFSFLSSI